MWLVEHNALRVLGRDPGEDGAGRGPVRELTADECWETFRTRMAGTKVGFEERYAVYVFFR